MSSPTPALVSANNPLTDSELQAQQIKHKQDIEKLAYALWQRRGCPHGSAEEDWGGAERIRRNEELDKFTGRQVYR